MTPTAGHSASMLKTETVDGIATIAINRPHLLNSVNPVTLHQLQQVFDHAAADPEIQGIVLRGEGKTFVVGADIDFFIRNVEAGDFQRLLQFTKAGHKLMNAIARCQKPVVACVHGAALGAGTEFALACGRVVASPHATFGFPETGLGIYPGFGGTQRTPRAIGIGLAKWLILAGKTLTAADARHLGLVDRVVPDNELADVCRDCALGRLARDERPPLPPSFAAIAQFFANNRADDLRNGTAADRGDPLLVRATRPVASKAPVALRLSEWLIEEGMRRPLDEALQLEIDHAVEIFQSEDAYRGLSFCAQRHIGRPQFVGR